MSNIFCLLDACTVINLIHIDEDDFILKKVSNLDLHINDVVFHEIKANVYDRLNNSHIPKYADRKSIQLRKKNIDQKLVFFRGKKNNNENLFSDLGDDYFDKIKRITGYNKKLNGELCSTAYALYLSRINEKKINFYTDDYGAKEHFLPFFDFQQIGQIKDSVDLLILLYWLDEKFTDQQLNNILSELYSQYAIEVSVLRQNLQQFYDSNVDAKFIKTKKEIAENLRILIRKLEDHDFKQLDKIYNFFEQNPKAQEIHKILKIYNSVFLLEQKSTSEDLLRKISKIRKILQSSKIYKLDDLLRLRNN